MHQWWFPQYSQKFVCKRIYRTRSLKIVCWMILYQRYLLLLCSLQIRQLNFASARCWLYKSLTSRAVLFLGNADDEWANIIAILLVVLHVASVAQRKLQNEMLPKVSVNGIISSSWRLARVAFGRYDEPTGNLDSRTCRNAHCLINFHKPWQEI